MLETGALSPEVKKLFAQIAKQAEEYNKIFKRVEFATNEFEQDRTNMTQELAQIRDDIANSINNLETFATNTIDEFKEKTETTHTLFKDLDKIDKLKSELFDLRDEIRTQSIDLSNSLVEFNAKADKALEGTVSQIKTRLNNAIDEEVTKIEGRVVRRLIAFEKNQKVFERRILSIDANVKGELKKLSSEIDFVYNNITEIKSDVATIMSSVMEKINYFNTEVPRISKLLDNAIAKMNDKLGKGTIPSSTSSKSDNNDYDGPIHDGEYDDTMFDFEAAPYGEPESDGTKKMTDRELMEFIKEEIELLEIKNDTDGKKNTLAMILSIASLIGVITLLIIMIVS
jgi:predicted  nucleic acid-binding Zn-ribbon protein